ncbi:MAG TPA: thymidine phosphorylase [Acidobacteriota bacterium]|nr:thymidine phosphorylase [Acidobacteriota bacterium]
MNVVEIIRKKRDREANLPEEIKGLVAGVVEGKIPDYQISAWLMAAYLNGLNAEETRSLTRALIDSGRTVDLSHISGLKVDKHSTGGVGDKTSPVIAPIVAAAGGRVPMISGRGLGHTGGTLDKLESIPGFRVDLSLQRFIRLVEEEGFALIGQTDEFTPGDRILYGLRDVTATVESIPLIVSSIISKKVAEGIDALVLDVKTGDGAFMKTLDRSEELARALTEAGRGLGKRVVALITDMSQPLGRTVGNALEIRECIEVLSGQGPQDLRRLCIELSAYMLWLSELAEDLDSARRLAGEQISSGRALRSLQRLIEKQHGDPRVVDDTSRLPGPRSEFQYTGPQSGFLQQARAASVGRAAMLLGAGRQTKDSKINPAVGIEMLKKVGDPVAEGEALALLHYDEEDRLQAALRELESAFRISPESVEAPPLIHKVIE